MCRWDDSTVKVAQRSELLTNLNHVHIFTAAYLPKFNCVAKDTSQSHPSQFLAKLDSLISVLIYNIQYKSIHETKLNTAEYSFM